MESKFNPFFQMIPLLADPISSSFAYDPEPGFEEEEVED